MNRRRRQSLSPRMPHRRVAFILAYGLCVLASGGVYADESNDKLTEAALENRSRLEFDGAKFSGPAWELLLAAARDTQFFMIGEEHGIAENPKLAAQLFTTLVAHGYEKLAVEISPPAAKILDAAADANGIEGIRDLFASPGGEPAFFGMREEAELIAAARSALPDASEVLWGVDYEIACDRPLLRQLQSMERPASTNQPLDALVAASNAAWARYEETGGAQFIFSFSGDPALVTAVKEAWPDAGDSAVQILDTLQSTLEINQLWVQGRGWDSNVRRAALLRSNFLRHWSDAKQTGNTPRVMVKLGGNHIVRGRNTVGTFDLGTLLPEIAALEGSRSLSMLVLPDPESMVAVLNPATWSFEPAPAKDSYAKGLEVLTNAAYDDDFTLIDLHALRSIVAHRTDQYGSEVARVVHGYDLLLLMSGSTASTELDHD